MTTAKDRVSTTIGLGDFLDFDAPQTNLIMTSPPYADRRKNTPKANLIMTSLPYADRIKTPHNVPRVPPALAVGRN